MVCPLPWVDLPHITQYFNVYDESLKPVQFKGNPMTEMVAIHETSEIAELKVGMWLMFSAPMNYTKHPEFVYIRSLSNGYASLSNGLTINSAGKVIDPDKGFALSEPEELLFAGCEAVAVKLISKDEFIEREKLARDEDFRYAEHEYKTQG
jgi:hypothetical protein